MKKELEFPDGFLWGAATSSYQVEGGINNCNWSEDFPAGEACDLWNRFEEYYDIAKELGQNAHRLSLEWSRIEPEEGKFDQEAITHYRDMLISLRKRNIKTMVTLWHFTEPKWLSAKGGWTNAESPRYFRDYANFVVKELDGYVDFWVTLNESGLYVSLSYLLGKFPPQRRRDVWGWGRALFNLALSHKAAYRVIKETNPQAQAGMAENYSFVEPLYKDPVSRFIVQVWDFLRNRMFLEFTRRQQDFIGVNYYFHERLVWDVRYPFVSIHNSNKVVSDRGHEIYPKGIYEVIKRMRKYDLPIYITENGLADKEDRLRAQFIRDHLKWVHKAIQEGADVRGYFHWSLLDNFEWEEKYGPCYGLLAMDFKDVTYSIRPSAREYERICKDNKLIIEK